MVWVGEKALRYVQTLSVSVNTTLFYVGYYTDVNHLPYPAPRYAHYKVYFSFLLIIAHSYGIWLYAVSSVKFCRYNFVSKTPAL